MSLLVSTSRMLLMPWATGAPPKIPQPFTATHNLLPQHDSTTNFTTWCSHCKMIGGQFYLKRLCLASGFWWHALYHTLRFMFSFKLLQYFLNETLGGREEGHLCLNAAEIDNFSSCHFFMMMHSFTTSLNWKLNTTIQWVTCSCKGSAKSCLKPAGLNLIV